jgi:hypothetical protein
VADRLKDAPVIVSCGSCGYLFGMLGDLGQKALIDYHYQTCTDYLNGEGLKKGRPIAYHFEDDDA